MVGEAMCSRDVEKEDGMEECDIVDSIMWIWLVRVSTIAGDRDLCSYEHRGRGQAGTDKSEEIRGRLRVTGVQAGAVWTWAWVWVVCR